MPFYEYQCRSCQYYVEVMQKIADPPLRKCPSCGRMTLVKLISAPVFRLKGSGWYETDFKSEKEAKRNLAGSDRDSGPQAAEQAQAKPAPEGQPSAKDTGTAAAATPAPAPSKTVPAPDRPARRRAKSGARPLARERVKKSAPKRATRGRRR